MSSEVSASVPSEDLPGVRAMTGAELVYGARRALESENGALVRDYFMELRKMLVDPGELTLVLDIELRGLLQTSLCSALGNVPLAALSVLTDSLQSLGNMIVVEKNASLIKVLLRLIKLDVILVATTSEILVPAFEALAWWCSRGKTHRTLFLEIFPIEFLDEIYTPDCPLDVFTSYISLVATIIQSGNDCNGVLPMVLQIFTRSLRDRGVGKTCEIAETICISMSNVVDDFQADNVVEEILESRLTSALVRHVMALPTYVFPGACVRTCLGPMMKVFVNLMVSSEEYCQRFVDQGILSVMEVSLAGQISESCRFTCMALTNAFAHSPFSIEYALNSTMAERLFQLRESPDQRLRKEALRATSNIFSRASSAQIFSMIKKGHVPDIVKLLRSTYEDVVSNGLLSLVAMIAATNFTDPLKLPALHALLKRHEVDQLGAVLRHHKIKEIRLAAETVHKFMTKYLDERQLGSGAIPKWWGTTRESSPSAL